MQTTVIKTGAVQFQKARSVNYTTNGYPTLIPTHTEPIADAGTATGQAAVNLVGSNSPGAPAPNAVMVCPYGLHASPDGKTMSFRLIGWRCVGFNAPNTSLWIPVPLGEFACTLSGTQIGVAGMTLIATEALADTITLTGTTANANVGVEIVSPANDTPAHVIADLKGAMKLEIIFTTGGSATSANALYALL